MELVNELEYNGITYRVNDIIKIKYRMLDHIDSVKIIAIANTNYFLCRTRYNESMMVLPSQIISKEKKDKELEKIVYKANYKKVLEMLIFFYEAEKDK